MKKIFQATQCLSLEELTQYSKGKVSDDLRYKIENHLVDCPLCSEAIEGFGDVEEDSNELFEDLYQEIDNRTSGAAPDVKRRFPYWNNIAAGLVFLVALGAAFLYFQNGQTSENYQAYFENEDKTIAVRAIDQGRIAVAMQKGVKLFKEKNFQGSYSFFEDYIKLNPSSTVATYYAGMSALNIGEQGMALDLLSTVRMNDAQLYEEATWNIAGIYLERGDIKMAKNYLTDLTKVENGFYVDTAAELLKKIK